MKQPMIQNQHGIRTAAYCRLSKDDEQIGESASIRTEHQSPQLPADASGH